MNIQDIDDFNDSASSIERNLTQIQNTIETANSFSQIDSIRINLMAIFNNIRHLGLGKTEISYQDQISTLRRSALHCWNMLGERFVEIGNDS